MTTIADIRDRVRRDLHDIDPDTERWEDAQLDRHIARALNELSLSLPRETSTTLPVIPGSRTVSIAGLVGLIAVEAVEYPVDEYPPIYASFSHWDDDLMLHLDEAPQSGEVRVFYLARHTLDESGTTLPEVLEDVVATGAGAFAALEWANYAIDRLNTGEDVAARYAAWGRAAHTAFVQMLLDHARRRRLRERRLFVPA